MAQLTIRIPDDLAQRLKGLASAQNKSVQALALERLQSLVSTPGSPTAVLRAMKEKPHLSPAALDEVESGIADGRLPVNELGPFEN